MSNKLTQILDIKRVKNYPLYMVIPAVLILLLLTIYPFIYLIYVRSHIWPISPTLPKIFLGFGQFTYLFQDPTFIESLKVTVNLMVVGVTIQIALGTLLAILLSTKTRITSYFTLPFMIPVFISPVVVGLIVYLYLSRSGPLGFLSLLYTPTAMIIAQMLLVIPIIAALSAQIIEDLHIEYRDLFRSLNVSTFKAIMAYIIDARMSLLTVILAGFGRAISEVGAVSIVGGNIDHLTRVMTTAIALETSRGNLSLALALGFILLAIALGVNIFAVKVKNWAMDK